LIKPSGMRQELEELLKAYDAFKEAPEGLGASDLHEIYLKKLSKAAKLTATNEETLRDAVAKWLKANLPAGFPKKLGLK